MPTVPVAAATIVPPDHGRQGSSSRLGRFRVTAAPPSPAPSRSAQGGSSAFGAVGDGFPPLEPQVLVLDSPEHQGAGAVGAIGVGAGSFGGPSTSGPASDGSSSGVRKLGRFTVCAVERPSTDDVVTDDSSTTPDSASFGAERPDRGTGVNLRDVENFLRVGKEITSLFEKMRAQLIHVIGGSSGHGSSSSGSSSLPLASAGSQPHFPGSSVAPMPTATPHPSSGLATALVGPAVDASTALPVGGTQPAPSQLQSARLGSVGRQFSGGGIAGRAPNAGHGAYPDTLAGGVGGVSGIASGAGSMECTAPTLTSIGAPLVQPAPASGGLTRPAMNDEAINLWEALGKQIERATKRNRQLEDENQKLKRQVAEKTRELDLLERQQCAQQAAAEQQQAEATPAVGPATTIRSADARVAVAGAVAANPLAAAVAADSGAAAQLAVAAVDGSGAAAAASASAAHEPHTPRGPQATALPRLPESPGIFRSMSVPTMRSEECTSAAAAEVDESCSKDVQGYGHPDTYRRWRNFAITEIRGDSDSGVPVASETVFS